MISLFQFPNLLSFTIPIGKSFKIYVLVVLVCFVVLFLQPLCLVSEKPEEKEKEKKWAFEACDFSSSG